MYVPNQWEKMLHCNVISHWLYVYTKWFLHEINIADKMSFLVNQPTGILIRLKMANQPKEKYIN